MPDLHAPETPRLLRLLGWSRFLIVVAILCSFVAATVLLLSSASDTLGLVQRSFARHDVAWNHESTLAAIELCDTFLLATVLYVVAIGLYQLFIDANVPLPDWLVITDIDELKHKLVSVVITVLAIVFLGQVLVGHDPKDVQPLGVGIAAVIASLTYFLGHREPTPTRSIEGNEGPTRHAEGDGTIKD